MTKNLNYFGGAQIVHDSSNCKLSNVQHVNYLWGATRDDVEADKVQRIKNFLKGARTVVNINTIDVNIKNFFEKHFKVHSSIEVPVGYSNGNQYHLILNNDKGYWRVPDKKPIPKLNTDMSNLEEVLTKILKSKRRKTDIVKDVLENLKYS